MAIRFHKLPVEEFPDTLQPRIKRLNMELRDLFGLEGVLRDTRDVIQRSDRTVTRQKGFQVAVTRVSGLQGGASPVSELTDEMIDTLNGEDDLTWDFGFGPVLSVVDDLGDTRLYRITLTWNASVTPKRPMIVLAEVT